jgi:hypothetical protein
VTDAWPWITVALLGAYHGINPAMGWLFAVALGLQEQSRKAVLRALVPIALGHELSIAVVVALVSGLELVASADYLRIVGAVALISFGIYKFLKPRSHPRWVGMRVTLPELGLWSFLMSTAHGAGLMLFPVVLGLGTGSHDHAGHDHSHGILGGGLSLSTVLQDGGAVMLHTGVMLLVMGVIAVLVFDKLGVNVLRKAWLNLDSVWAAALIGAGVFTLFT